MRCGRGQIYYDLAGRVRMLEPQMPRRVLDVAIHTTEGVAYPCCGGWMEWKRMQRACSAKPTPGTDRSTR